MLDRKIKNKIDQSTTVSFDIFDTIICRGCSKPDYVFNIVARQINIEEEKFHNDRVEAERKARNGKGKREITLYDIYECLPDEYSSLKSKLIELEIHAEENVVYRNRDLIEIYDYCIKEKRVILISDMYLDSNVLKRLLDICGISGFEKIYVSCECGSKKSDGSLFEYVLEKENMKAQNLLHFGDNLKSDYINSIRKGITAHFVKKTVDNEPKENDLSILNAFIERKLTNENPYYKFGFRYLGPAIYGYVSWVQEQLMKRQINKVFFLPGKVNLLKRHLIL